MFQVSPEVPGQESGLQVRYQPHGCLGLSHKVRYLLGLPLQVGRQNSVPSLVGQGNSSPCGLGEVLWRQMNSPPFSYEFAPRWTWLPHPLPI